MNKIYIYGAGGAGRELSFNLSCGAFWRVGGFIDDTPEKQGKYINGIKVLGGIECLRHLQPSISKSKPQIAMSIVDDPRAKAALIDRIAKIRDVEFPPICVPHNLISQYVIIGEGTLIAQPFNHIPSDCSIGKHVWINSYNGIGHDAVIGDYTTLFSNINVGGYTRIGSLCVIGSGVTIKPHTKIGDNVIVGAGSVVVKDVPDNVVIAGNPAKVLRENIQ